MARWMQKRMRRKRAFWATEGTDARCEPFVVTVLYLFCILHDGYMGRTLTIGVASRSSLALRRIRAGNIPDLDLAESFSVDPDDRRDRNRLYYEQGVLFHNMQLLAAVDVVQRLLC